MLKCVMSVCIFSPETPCEDKSLTCQTEQAQASICQSPNIARDFCPKACGYCR